MPEQTRHGIGTETRADSVPAADDTIGGGMIGRFVIVGARPGGMGHVYVAHDPHLDACAASCDPPGETAAESRARPHA